MLWIAGLPWQSSSALCLKKQLETQNSVQQKFQTYIHAQHCVDCGLMAIQFCTCRKKSFRIQRLVQQKCRKSFALKMLFPPCLPHGEPMPVRPTTLMTVAAKWSGSWPCCCPQYEHHSSFQSSIESFKPSQSCRVALIDLDLPRPSTPLCCDATFSQAC